jgi:CBS domain containing-hemolysin-like protein
MALDIIITLLLVLSNGFFVAAEFAIVKIRGSQLEVKIKQGNKTAMLAKQIVSHLDGYLAATQLGITLASLGLGWIGEPVVSKIIINIFSGLGLSINEQIAHQIALPVAFAIITILHIVFGELAPKSIAIQRSERTTLAVAFPLRFFYIIFRPFIWVLNGIANFLLKLLGIAPVHGSEVHSSDELKFLVKQGREAGAVETTDFDLILNAFNFSELTVKQILIPRTQISAIEIKNFNESTLEKVIDEGYSRFPVFSDSLDHIVGIIFTKDLLLKMRKKEPVNIEELMRPAMFIPEGKHIGQLLKDFQKSRQQMAIVVDEYGDTKGMVTMEDLLEELVGEIQDEYDNESALVKKLDDSTYLVQASGMLSDINKALPYPIETDDYYVTLAGAIINELNHIPKVEEKLYKGNYEITVLKMTDNAIATVQLVVHS